MGFDLTGDIPALADWLTDVEGPLTLGDYVYADGAANVRVASAVDALTVRLAAGCSDVSLAFLATPTDVFAQQGPNYVLAKRLQRWRATVARDGGATVSMNVAPPTRTRSVTRNRVLAAAYAGAGRFGVEVFEPAATRTLMAALLVHDLDTGGGPDQAHPWQDEARAAAHGGLWRIAYTPRSALGLAALLGYLPRPV